MPLTITTNFAGTYDERVLSRALTGNETVQKGLLMPRIVEDKESFSRVTVTNFIQDRVPTPTSGGDASLDERFLKPEDYMGYLEFNSRLFEHHWLEYAMDGELVFRELPEPVRVAMVSEVLKIHDNYLGIAIWQNRKTSPAATAPYNKFDGLLYKLDVDANTLKVTSPVALTTANIIAKVKDVRKRAPVAVRNNPNFKIIMSYEDFELWGDALEALTYKGQSPENAVPTSIRETVIVPVLGMPKDNMVAGIFTDDFQSNFRIGMARGNNAEFVQVERLQANSELFFLKMLMKCDVQVGFTDEAVLYKV
jgi:hypothetical protein